MTIKTILTQIAKKVDGTVRSDYSGRFMFGRKCYGIVTPDPIACIMLAGRFGLPRPSQDEMGRSAIIYWTDFDEAAVQPEAGPEPED